MKMMRFGGWVGLLVSLALFAAVPASAAGLTGTQLLADCSSTPTSAGRTRCVSYIAGVIDGIDTLVTSSRLLHPGSNAYPKMYCLPVGIKAENLVAPLVSYLRQHADDLHFGASSEVMLGLMQIYPCPDDMTTTNRER